MNQSRKSYLLDDYWLAPGEQLLSRSGQAIHLPKKPFQVLTYLVEHRDRFVSRAELLDQFWDGKDVYDDALRGLLALGPAAIRRASHVEPTPDGRWTADLGPMKGPVLGPFETRAAALHAEQGWLLHHFGHPQ